MLLDDLKRVRGRIMTVGRRALGEAWHAEIIVMARLMRASDMNLDDLSDFHASPASTSPVASSRGLLSM